MMVITVPYFTVHTVNLTLKLHLEFFSCNYDSVEVRDGASVIAPLIGRYCGKTVPGSLYSTGSFLFVRMVTDESLARKGFNAKYKIGNTFS